MQIWTKDKDRTIENNLWCPFAEIGETKMVTKGKYRKGFPEGAVIHYTAGRDSTESDAKNTLKWGIEQEYCFFVIGPTGVIYQNFSLDSWGSHSGKSSYGPYKEAVSKYLVGIEVVCAGKVLPVSENTFGAWFHFVDGNSPKSGVKKTSRLYSSEEVRHSIEQKETYVQEGYYKTFTAEQESSLTQLLLWLKRTNSNVFNFKYVLGHMEVSPYRKADPGASISMGMIEYRTKLKNLHEGFKV